MSEPQPCHRSGGCIYPKNCTRLQRCIDFNYKEALVDNKAETTEQEPIDTFVSGAATSGRKPPYECLTSTLFRRSAKRMEKGWRYGKHNWKKGIQDKSFIVDRLNHAIEHLTKAQQEIENGVLYDDDDLAAVVVNVMFAMEYQEWFDGENKLKRG